ncbi:MAG: SDR family oxidoreductase [Bacteroidetes bacterium]|nr:SDR family oxidoreductase [Bacteroidota bacterium]
MILVTGSTGHFGKATIDFLLKTIPSSGIAALARDKNKAADLAAKGIDIRTGDYTDFDSMVKAFTGIEKLLLISSNDMNDRGGQHVNAINAAKKAGVRHIVYTSADIKDPFQSAIAFITDGHVKAENQIKNSGMTYTILKNNLYAECIPMFLGEKLPETGVFFPAGTGKTPFAARIDMAEAAAHVLTTEGHGNKEYSISSDKSYSFSDVADILSEISGKKIEYLDPPKEVFTEQLIKAGIPEMYVGFTAAFAEAIKRDEFNLPGTTLESLLGRKPLSLKAFLQTVYSTSK